VSEYFSNFYLPHYFGPFVLLYGQETQMSADIKTFVTHVLQQGFLCGCDYNILTMVLIMSKRYAGGTALASM
jgi:hypothetical protein